MADNCIKIGELIDWIDRLKGKKHSGSANKVGDKNPFDDIPQSAGIYKVCILDNEVSFVKGATIYGGALAKETRDAQVLKEIYDDNIKSDIDIKHVIYIGKANVLRRRIKQYIKSAFGGKNHNGGIDIWAVQDYEKILYIEWHKLDNKQFKTPREMEEKAIKDFKKDHGARRPLANRED